MLDFFAKKRLQPAHRSPAERAPKGFTLIELLVVIAVIGLLASIVLVSLGPARAKARDAARQADIRQINLAMEMCYDDSTCGAGIEKYISVATAGARAIANIDTDSTPCYLCPVPCDPSDTTCTTGSIGDYVYKWSENSGVTDIQKYCVYTKLEAVAKWIAASEKGTRLDLTAAPPTTLSDTVSCW